MDTILYYGSEKGLSYNLRLRTNIVSSTLLCINQFGEQRILLCFLGLEAEVNFMNQRLKNAIEAYVLLLPDMYSSPDDYSRLVRIAYEFEISDARFDDEFKDFFIQALSNKFNRYDLTLIENFYQERKEQIEGYVYVIGRLKSMDLLKLVN